MKIIGANFKGKRGHSLSYNSSSFIIRVFLTKNRSKVVIMELGNIMTFFFAVFIWPIFVYITYSTNYNYRQNKCLTAVKIQFLNVKR